MTWRGWIDVVLISLLAAAWVNYGLYHSHQRWVVVIILSDMLLIWGAITWALAPTPKE